MRKAIWLFFIRWIEQVYVGSSKPKSSQIIDGCIAIKDGPEEQLTARSE